MAALHEYACGEHAVYLATLRRPAAAFFAGAAVAVGTSYELETELHYRL